MARTHSKSAPLREEPEAPQAEDEIAMQVEQERAIKADARYEDFRQCIAGAKIVFPHATVSRYETYGPDEAGRQLAQRIRVINIRIQSPAKSSRMHVSAEEQDIFARFKARLTHEADAARGARGDHCFSEDMRRGHAEKLVITIETHKQRSVIRKECYEIFLRS